MMWTIYLVLITLGLGGALEKTSCLKSIINASIGETNALLVSTLPVRPEYGNAAYLRGGRNISTVLDKRGVAVRTGQHYTGLLMAHLRLNATCRASFGLCNTNAEVDVLIEALELAHDLLS